MKADILTFRRESLPSAWLDECGATPMTYEVFSAVLSSLPPTWIGRQQAEVNQGYKQLIPYILCQYDGHLATYQRRGSESRLHDLWSIGIGGHIDAEDNRPDLMQTLLTGARRELAEELPGVAEDVPLTLLGVINEERTEVGTVHLGIVMTADLSSLPETRGSDELSRLHWRKPEALAELELELWSRLALQLYHASVHTARPNAGLNSLIKGEMSC